MTSNMENFEEDRMTSNMGRREYISCKRGLGSVLLFSLHLVI
jgi:hypothetical protein